MGIWALLLPSQHILSLIVQPLTETLPQETECLPPQGTQEEPVRESAQALVAESNGRTAQALSHGVSD